MTDQYSLRFKRIDNKVKITLNNASIWESEIIHNDPPLNIEVPLNTYFQPGKNTILIELYNSPSGQYNPWRIEYDIEKNGNIIGSVAKHYTDHDGSGGWKFSETHTFNV